jgi:diaphanous 1
LDLEQALRYIKPPDSLLTQLDVYTEEKYEDEEDIREHVQAVARGTVHTRTGSESEAVLEEIIRLARQHGELYPIMVETLKRYGLLLQRHIDP